MQLVLQLNFNKYIAENEWAYSILSFMDLEFAERGSS